MHGLRFHIDIPFAKEPVNVRLYRVQDFSRFFKIGINGDALIWASQSEYGSKTQKPINTAIPASWQGFLARIIVRLQARHYEERPVAKSFRARRRRLALVLGR